MRRKNYQSFFDIQSPHSYNFVLEYARKSPQQRKREEIRANTLHRAVKSITIENLDQLQVRQ